jgi:hypothetical protein
MPEELRQNLFLLGLIIFFLAFHILGFLLPFYFRRKKAGRLDASKSFLENLCDSVYP